MVSLGYNELNGWYSTKVLMYKSQIAFMATVLWWRHQMEILSALLALCVGNSPGTGPVTRNFDVFFDLRLNKRLSKQSWGWWFETPLRSLWRHCNVLPVLCLTRCPLFQSYRFLKNCVLLLVCSKLLFVTRCLSLFCVQLISTDLLLGAFPDVF